MMESATGMAYQATRERAGVRPALSLLRSEPLRAAWRVFWPTRLAVALVAVFAALSLGSPGGGGMGERNAFRFDEPALTQPLGGFGDVAVSPLARWDAAWYLRIADSGYGESEARAAFFPLYPLLARGLGEVAGGSRGAVLLAALAISLVAFLAALALLWRLVELEIGRRPAGATVLLLAVFPGSLFFGAPYAESLFLLVSVGAFLAARTGRWPLAGACAFAAAATRSAGVLLLLPLVALYVAEHGRRPGREALWLLLGPLGLGAYAGWLGLAHGDGLAFLDVQDAWYREFAGPLGGVVEGLVAGFEGARQLLSGAREPVYFAAAGGDPFRVAGINLMLLGFLAFALVGVVGALRRLPLPYGLWAGVALALPLSFPAGPQPLMSLPRFLAVLFPLFMWLALVCEERRATARVAAVSALALGLFTAEYSGWRFIA